MTNSYIDRIREYVELLSDYLVYTLDERDKPVHPDDAQRVFDRAEFVLGEILRTASDMKNAIAG